VRNLAGKTLEYKPRQEAKRRVKLETQMTSLRSCDLQSKWELLRVLLGLKLTNSQVTFSYRTREQL